MKLYKFTANNYSNEESNPTEGYHEADSNSELSGAAAYTLDTISMDVCGYVGV